MIPSVSFRRLLLSIALVLSFLLLATLPVKAQCAVQPTIIRSGEYISYTLYYNLGFIWINAGSCDFTVKRTNWNGKGAWQLSVVGRTVPSFDGFFNVRDTFLTVVDSTTLIPFKASKFTHEDTWHGVDVFTFKPNKGGWQVTTNLKRKGQWKPPVVDETSQCGFDLVSSIYRLRSLNDPTLFKPGAKREIPIRLDDGEYTVYLSYQGKERLKVHKSGYYSAHLFTLSLVAGNVFKRGDVLKLWISDDGNKLPLMVESPIRVGKVKALFKQAAHTRYPVAVPER